MSRFALHLQNMLMLQKVGPANEPRATWCECRIDAYELVVVAFVLMSPGAHVRVGCPPQSLSATLYKSSQCLNGCVTGGICVMHLFC